MSSMRLVRSLPWMRRAVSFIALSAILATALNTLLFSSVASAAGYVFHDLYSFTTNDYVRAAGPGGQVAVGSGGGAYLYTPSSTGGTLLSGGSGALFTNGIQQVGYFESPTIIQDAMLWSGTALSTVDLDPVQIVDQSVIRWDWSAAFGAAGGEQVGFAGFAFPTQHAMIWNGTNTSFLDINPAGFTSSVAMGVSGNQTNGYQQVGYGTPASGGNHALLWNDSATSAVDLQPIGNIHPTYAIATDGTNQVGWENGGVKALLWSGTASSVVDLGPGFAFDVHDGKELGVSQDGGSLLVWSGTAASALNLNALLPANLGLGPVSMNPLINDTYKPFSFDSDGNIFAFARDIHTGVYHAIEFTPVPEPSSMVLVALGIFGLATGLCNRRGIKNGGLGK